MAGAGDESEDLRGAGAGAVGAVSLSEWQAWGTASPVPAMVAEVIEGLAALKNDTDAPMIFGGIGGKLQGSFKVQEDKKQRHIYKSLTGSEEKLRFFSARQIACRLLGSRGYLCQKCWIAAEDCMCSKLVPVSLWHGIRFWVYMHPKDFLRQNNTGKLLWQLFGVKAASLCLFGIPEHEDIMWDAFKYSGKNMVWFLYPNKSLTPHSVQDVLVDRSFTNPEGQIVDLGEKPLNFVLIDGTWSNSAAMYRRLKWQQAKDRYYEVYKKQLTHDRCWELVKNNPKFSANSDPYPTGSKHGAKKSKAKEKIIDMNEPITDLTEDHVELLDEDPVGRPIGNERALKAKCQKDSGGLPLSEKMHTMMMKMEEMKKQKEEEMHAKQQARERKVVLKEDTTKARLSARLKRNILLI